MRPLRISRPNRRGAFLVIFGAVFLLLGYSYQATRVTPAVRHALNVALEVAPLWVYAAGWLICGSLAIIGGIVERLDWLGFGAAVLMPMLWALVYLFAWLANDAPRGWVTAVLFVLIAAAIAVVAGMPEPRTITTLAHAFSEDEEL